MKTDILVIGAGPVGLFTVFEAGILGLKCTLIDNLDKPGGQCAELYPDKPIFDIPGVPYQTAQEHVDALLKQIEPFDYDLILNERVESMSKKDDVWIVTTNKGSKVETPNIFIAAGAGSFEPIKPNLERDYSSLEGNKIFYAIKDKTLFKDKKVAIEIDGHSTNELLDVGEAFTKLSDRVILKIPMSVHALGAFAELKKANVETFCTTIFTLNQAVLAANAGVTHLLPFCEPFIDVNKDSTELIRELKSTFDGWENRPFITAALVRSVTTAHKAIKDGADGIIIFWPIFEEMIKSKMTDEWNKIFLDNWIEYEY